MPVKISFLLAIAFATATAPSWGVVVISAEPDRQWAPELAFGPDTFLVVWQDCRTGQPNTEDVYAARVSPQGEVLDPHGFPIAVKIGALKFIRQPLWDGAKWFVHWMTDSTNGDVWLMGARVTRNGVVLDPEGKRLLNYYGDQFNQSASFDGQNFFVVWYDARQSGNGAGLYGARVTRDLVTLDPEGILLWSVPAGEAEMVFDGQNYCVVWPEFPDPQHPRVYAGRVRPDGVVLDTIPISVFPGETTGVDGVNVPDIAYGGEIYFITACRDSGLTYPDIIGARITPQGALLDSSAIMVSRIVERTAYRFQPRVDFNGEFFQVVWYSNTRALSRVIEGARVEPSGWVRDTAQVRVIRENTGAQHDPNVASGRGKQSLVVWGNESPSREFDLYGAFVDTSGREVGVHQEQQSIRESHRLQPSIAISPIPVRRGATITLSLPCKGVPFLSLYDAIGRKVCVIKTTNWLPTSSSGVIFWDGRDEEGMRISSGVYFLKLEVKEESAVIQRVVVVR
jgi:hypothetical protein